MRTRKPSYKQYYKNNLHYKVIDPSVKHEIGFCGFTLDYVEKKYPHCRIVKITSHHLFQCMNKNHRNAN